MLWDRLETAYVSFRNEINTSDEDGDTPIPLTARKLEALQRLAEASARSRLSDTVAEEDIDRAMRLTRKSMEHVGKDPEIGEFDADIVETGQSKSQRDRKKEVSHAFKTRKQLIHTFDRESAILECECGKTFESIRVAAKHAWRHRHE